ncbi:hypothetical protein BB558_006923, partial [Smittium angustum]
VFKNNEIGDRATEKRRHLSDILHRRHSNHWKVSRRMSGTHRDHSPPPQESWLYIEYGEVSTNSKHQSDFPRISVQHHKNVYQSNSGLFKKDPPGSLEGATSTTYHQASHGPKRSLLSGSCSMPCTSFSTATVSMSLVSKYNKGFTMVEQSTIQLGQFSNYAETGGSKRARICYDGYFGYRLGYNKQLYVYRRGLEQTDETTVLKLQRSGTFLYALKLHAPFWKNQQVWMQTNNITAKNIFTNGGTTAGRKLVYLAKEWWETIIQQGLRSSKNRSVCLSGKQSTEEILSTGPRLSISGCKRSALSLIKCDLYANPPPLLILPILRRWPPNGSHNHANFLAWLKLKPSSVLVYSTAISEYWLTLDPTSKPETEDRVIQKLLQGKKTVILLALSTFWRPRSELQGIMLTTIKKSEDEKYRYLWCPENKKGKAKSKSIWLSPFDEDENICPVKTLDLYLEKTKNFAKEEYADTMFYVEKPSVRPASNDSVARWIKEPLMEISATESAHSTRGVSATKAYLAGVKLEDILLQAD